MSTFHILFTQYNIYIILHTYKFSKVFHILCETLRKIFTYFSYNHIKMPIFLIIFNQVCRFTELPKESYQTFFKYQPSRLHTFQTHFTSLSHKWLPVVCDGLRRWDPREKELIVFNLLNGDVCRRIRSCACNNYKE